MNGFFGVLVKCKCGKTVFCDVEENIKDGDLIKHNDCSLEGV